MVRRLSIILFAVLLATGWARADEPRDPARDILVTFVNPAAAPRSGVRAPYRNRKRYNITAQARRQAREIAAEYTLIEVDSWPIKALSVYCVVFRVDDAQARAELVRRLSADRRVESAQAVQEFETGTELDVSYDDTYVNLQHGIKTMAVSAAHRHSQGRGIRVAIVDSDVDRQHEDLKGRLDRIESYSADGKRAEIAHGTAIASVIGARANNAKGIVGIAPAAEIDLYAACWATGTSGRGVCDSFSLAKALDTLAATPPDIVNMSLTGPHDELLARLLRALSGSGTIIVAALASSPGTHNLFPASLPEVIAVGSSRVVETSEEQRDPVTNSLYAPGRQILVAVPDDQYDFRSGSSIAAAHVSGVIALLLADNPGLSAADIRDILARSQGAGAAGLRSVNACAALQLANAARTCT